MDEDVIRKWPAKKLRGWLTYLQVRDDLEREAYERAKRAAALGVQHAKGMKF